MNATVINILTILLLGFIVGWGLEFALDFLYWRRRPEYDDTPGEAPETSVKEPQVERAAVDRLRLALDQRDRALVDTQRHVSQREEDLSRAQLMVSDHENTITHLRQQLAGGQAELEQFRSSLPAEQLAARDTEISGLHERLSAAEGDLSQAEQQAGEQIERLELLREQIAAAPQPEQVQLLDATADELEQVRDELQERQQEAGQIEQYLKERDAEVERLAGLLDKANADLEHLRQRELDKVIIAETEYVREDDLTDIKGIGDVYGQKLRDLGYHTFRHLADADLEELKTSLEIPEWRVPKLEDWTDQAQQLADEKEQQEE